jgi:hypothetical protein
MTQVVPAIIATNAIPRYLGIIPKIGVPDKVDVSYLKSIGFKNSNDRALVPLFKSLGFLDSSGKPTQVYRDYRAADGDSAKKILGDAVRQCYSGLFSTYSDAQSQDDVTVGNWIRANSDSGADGQRRALNTFKALRGAAIFDASSAPSSGPAEAMGTANEIAHTPERPPGGRHVEQSVGPDVHLDIQIHIPADATAEQIDQIFGSMAKHLYQR